MKKMAISIFLAAVLLLIYHHRIDLSYWILQWKYKGTVEFYSAKIVVPCGLIYQNTDKMLFFYRWDDLSSRLEFSKFELSKEQLAGVLGFYRTKGYEVIGCKDIRFKQYNAYEITYVDDAWIYTNQILIPDKSLIITYSGNKNNFNMYQGIIESMTWVE
ncbi:MAG: hypothetical protein JEZ02_04190 [Desulfatibacillum sp.]|nr:hypothetical protein [Desulfatibacillum sp.]